MTTMARALSPLEQQIAEARIAQRLARLDVERSPNTDTLRAEKGATRELNVLLDRLSAALKNQR